MSESFHPAPEDETRIESFKAFVSRKYLLPLAITLSLGLAALGSAGEITSLIRWDEIAESNRERYDDSADELHDGVWPDTGDIGFIGLAVVGVSIASVAYVGKRKLDEKAPEKH